MGHRRKKREQAVTVATRQQKVPLEECLFNTVKMLSLSGPCTLDDLLQIEQWGTTPSSARSALLSYLLCRKRKFQVKGEIVEVIQEDGMGDHGNSDTSNQEAETEMAVLVSEQILSSPLKSFPRRWSDDVDSNELMQRVLPLEGANAANIQLSEASKSLWAKASVAGLGDAMIDETCSGWEEHKKDLLPTKLSGDEHMFGSCKICDKFCQTLSALTSLGSAQHSVPFIKNQIRPNDEAAQKQHALLLQIEHHVEGHIGQLHRLLHSGPDQFLAISEVAKDDRAMVFGLECRLTVHAALPSFPIWIQCIDSCTFSVFPEMGINRHLPEVRALLHAWLVEANYFGSSDRCDGITKFLEHGHAVWARLRCPNAGVMRRLNAANRIRRKERLVPQAKPCWHSGANGCEGERHSSLAAPGAGDAHPGVHAFAQHFKLSQEALNFLCTLPEDVMKTVAADFNPSHCCGSADGNVVAQLQGFVRSVTRRLQDEQGSATSEVKHNPYAHWELHHKLRKLPLSMSAVIAQYQQPQFMDNVIHGWPSGHAFSTALPSMNSSPDMILLSPSDVCFAHDSISARFTCGRFVEATLQDLASGRTPLCAIPPLTVSWHNNRWFTYTGNRRLYVFRRLEYLGHLTHIEVETTKTPIPKWRLTTKNSGASVMVRSPPRHQIWAAHK